MDHIISKITYALHNKRQNTVGERQPVQEPVLMVIWILINLKPPVKSEFGYNFPTISLYLGCRGCKI